MSIQNDIGPAVVGTGPCVDPITCNLGAEAGVALGVCVRCVRRALLGSEILCLILDFIRSFDESHESELEWDRTSGKRTLASLARTCCTVRPSILLGYSSVKRSP